MCVNKKTQQKLVKSEVLYAKEYDAAKELIIGQYNCEFTDKKSRNYSDKHVGAQKSSNWVALAKKLKSVSKHDQIDEDMELFATALYAPEDFGSLAFLQIPCMTARCFQPEKLPFALMRIQAEQQKSTLKNMNVDDLNEFFTDLEFEMQDFLTQK